MQKLLASAHVATELRTSAQQACGALLVTEDENPPVVLVDATSTEDLQQLRATVPHIAPVVFAAQPSQQQIIAAFRAGAFDFLDVDAENDASILAALERAAAKTRDRLGRRDRLSGMRGLIEDFLRVLVRSERRSFELEERLEATESGRVELGGEHDSDRPPRVLVVDDDGDVVDFLGDVLAREGLRVETARCGVDAIEIVATYTHRGEPIDLLLIDKNLPDVDGIKVIGRLRQIHPGLAAMIMTGFASAESAIDAADLGVVGYVLKPFDDLTSLVRRIREVATRATHDHRERRYLDRIKDRHSEFLLRYRQLIAQLDKLS